MWTLVKIDGVSGDLVPSFGYRWRQSSEELFLNSKALTQSSSVTSETQSGLSLAAGDWPGFRGPNRNSHVKLQVSDNQAVRLSSATELWRRSVGPAWSSFAVVGNHIFTQEQRGSNEAVVCYSADSGEEIWSHFDKARFDTMLGGVGPRSTPTFADGRVFSVGATGVVNCLSATSGELQWQVNLVKEHNAESPPWGISCSPLIVGDFVLVHAPGENGGLVALQASDGAHIWTTGRGASSYSSPQLTTLGAQEQALLFTGAGLESFDPETGSSLWMYEYSAADAMEARIVQPAVCPDESVVVGSESKSIRLAVSQESGRWIAREMWSSRHLKPDFNDMVIHRGYAYGFDGNLLTCIDIENGKRQWRRRGFGKGQLLLLPKRDLLFVLAESGTATLAKASPEKFYLLDERPLLHGKTWNHPVIANGRLYVRNSNEAACYELFP